MGSQVAILAGITTAPRLHGWRVAPGRLTGRVAPGRLTGRVTPGRLTGGCMADSDWSALMLAAQAGNAQPYHRLLMEVTAWLRRYYAGRLPPAMVADAVQDTLLAIHEKRHTFDPSRPFEPWLAAIARYKWIDRLRAMKSLPTEPLTEDIAIADHGDGVSTA